MAKRKDKLGLSVFVQAYGTHAHAWRRPEVQAAGYPSFKGFADTVKLLERGKFDFAFFADFVGNGGDQVGNGKSPRARGFEPLTIVSALSQITDKIGLVATVNTNFNDPYNLSRRLASLDHITNGRAGWNIVSSLAQNAIKTFGLHERADREDRYERAAEFVDVAKSLWDSWDDDTFDTPNKETGVFYDPKKGHPLHHHGKHFSVDAILDIARPIQGYPVFFQAGNSDKGREFAARYAEVIYAAAQTLEEAKAYYDDVKGRLSKYGRAPEDVRVTPGLYYFIGDSRSEAQEKYKSFLESVDVTARLDGFLDIDLSSYNLDDPFPVDHPEPANNVGRYRQAVALARRENLTIREVILRFNVVQGHRIIVGTADDIADQIEDWFLNYGADGYQLKPDLLPDSLEAFVNKVVPLLQKKGIFRTEYEGTTLREHLGLKRPRNQYLGGSLAAAE